MHKHMKNVMDRRYDMKDNKLNNKGFSLVELIIVIAIMAILAAALAPQLIKYLEESRKTVDHQVMESIATCLNVAVKKDDIYKEVASSNKKTFDITFNSDGDVVWPASDFPKLSAEFSNTMGDISKPKTSGATKYVVSWKNDNNAIVNIQVVTG